MKPSRNILIHVSLSMFPPPDFFFVHTISFVWMCCIYFFFLLLGFLMLETARWLPREILCVGRPARLCPASAWPQCLSHLLLPFSGFPTTCLLHSIHIIAVKRIYDGNRERERYGEALRPFLPSFHLASIDKMQAVALKWFWKEPQGISARRFHRNFLEESQ